MFRGILEHARTDNQTKQSVFKLKESRHIVHLVTDKEMELVLQRLTKRRDILLYKMLYLTGARIQEILDLEIESIPMPDMSKSIGIAQQIQSKGKRRDLYIPMSLMYYPNTFTDEAALCTAIADYMAFYCTERMQARFNGKTPAEVRAEALAADVPKQYPIPENKRIQKYKARYAA